MQHYLSGGVVNRGRLSKFQLFLSLTFDLENVNNSLPMVMLGKCTTQKALVASPHTSFVRTPVICSKMHRHLTRYDRTALLSGYIEPFQWSEGTSTPGGLATASKYSSMHSNPPNTMYTDTSPLAHVGSSNDLTYHLTPAGMLATPSEGGSSSSGGKGPAPNARARPVRQEVDAGPVPQADRDEGREEVLPPGYNPEWESGRSAP